MFDLYHLSDTTMVSEYVIKSSACFTWNKPPNVSFIFLFIIGCGGGGAGGASGSAGTARSGGSGGGSGAIAQALFLSSSIPNSLYITSIGNGAGLGGAANSNGFSGNDIYIANYPATSINQACFCYAIGGGGGTTSSSASGGSATIVANAMLLASAIYWSSTAGRAGTYALNSTPSSTSIGSALPILGGGGGGGVQSAPIIAYSGAGFSSEIPSIVQNIDGGTATSGNDASNGLSLPFVAIGGSGGGGNDIAPGGRGGNGVGYGTGGGGGGAGTLGGRGGDGGPGYIRIIAW